MSEELAALREEVRHLREELSALRTGALPPMRGPAGELRVLADDASTALALFDAEGHCRARFEIGEKGPVLELLGKGGSAAVSLKIIDGHGQLSAAAPDGVARAAVRSTKHGGVLKVMNERGRTFGYLLSAE